jgi:predicted nucleic acid-binding protein
VKLFDSSVLIAHLRGEAKATGLLAEAVSANEAYCSVLSRVELEGSMRSSERQQVGRLFSALVTVAVSETIAVDAGEQLRRYRCSHRGIDLVDYVIGATATVTGFDPQREALSDVEGPEAGVSPIRIPAVLSELWRLSGTCGAQTPEFASMSASHKANQDGSTSLEG